MHSSLNVTSFVIRYVRGAARAARAARVPRGDGAEALVCCQPVGAAAVLRPPAASGAARARVRALVCIPLT